MINFKSPYDSTEIREGLMNIKQSQMELLNQLKNQNHILRKYTPTNPIFQDKNDSNLYSSPTYSAKETFDSHFTSHHKPSNVQASSYLSSHQKDNYEQSNPKFSSATKGVSSTALQRELENMTEEFHRMKKNYFTQKQKNKDMVLHMEFAASLHNMILKDVLQGSSLQNIKSRVRTEVQSYQAEFTDFKAFGIEQAFNIINLQSDSSFIESRTPRRTQIFPKQQDNSQMLKQLNDLKCELRQISLEKQRKSQQVILMKSENDYTMSLLNKQIEMKNGKINELVSEIIRQKETSRLISTQNNDLRSNLQRLKSELQRNLNKVEILQTFQRKTTQTIDKQHKYIKIAKQLEDKVAFLEKESRQKSKLIQIHQQNLNKTNEMARILKVQNDKIKAEAQEARQTQEKKSMTVLQLQQKIQNLQKSYQQEITMVSRRNQTEQSSLKQHITELKKSLEQLLRQQESYKQSQHSLQEMKHRKMQTFKLSKTIDHLWKIKQVEYQNIHQVLTQLNLIKTQEIQTHSQRLLSGSQAINMARKDSSHSARVINSREKASSSREKSKDRGNNF